MEYKGKIAVITGGGGGIGHGIALACLKEGMKIVLADINDERLAKQVTKLKGEVGGEIITFHMDATTEQGFRDLLKFTLDTYGHVNFLFNNAGIHFHKDFMLLTDKDWEFILRSNLWSVMYGMRIFLPVMEKNEDIAYVINVASGAAVSFGTTMAHYNTCKAGVLLMTGSVLNESRARGSKVNFMTVMPAFVTSNLMESVKDLRQPQWQNEVEEKAESDKQMEQFFYAGVQHPYDDPSLIPGLNEKGVHTISNEEAGGVIMQHIKDGKNFCFTHAEWAGIAAAYGRMLEGGYIKPTGE